MVYPQKFKKQAQDMRREGDSILKIAHDLKVAKSTVSLWVRGVELPESLKKHLVLNSEKGCAAGRIFQAARRKAQAEEDWRAAKSLVRRVVPTDGQKDFWQFVAALLFWCEGGKRRLSCLEFTNSDPAMVKTYLRALRRGFELDETKFRVGLHIHEYHDCREQVIFWTRVTRIPSCQFHRPYLKPHTGTVVRLGYPGCVSIIYGSSSLAKKLTAIYHTFAQHMGD